MLKIARMGHPVLQRRAEPVADPASQDVQRLIDDMYETMVDAGGAGIAAPQVHVPLRIVMFFVPGNDDEDAEGARNAAGQLESLTANQRRLTVLINPIIDILTDETADDWEGCLSVPGLRGMVPRYTRLKYSGYDRQGHYGERLATDFHARVVQHECDHLDGILYPARMTDLDKLIYTTEFRHHTQAEPAETAT